MEHYYLAEKNCVISNTIIFWFVFVKKFIFSLESANVLLMYISTLLRISKQAYEGEK